MKIASLTVALLMSGSAFAAPVCDDLAHAVDDGVRKMARASMSDGNEFLNQMTRNAEVGLVQANLSLMLANKCVPPKGPLDDSPYLQAALNCKLADSRASRAGDKALPQECDRDKWAKQEREHKK